jgi:hypothetical protein
MRAKVPCSCVMTIAILAMCLVFVSSDFAQSIHRPQASETGSLEGFLRDCLKVPDYGGDRTTRYSAAWVDLKDNGTYEVIVYYTGQFWCGSGGCRMMVLTPNGTSFRIVSSTIISRLPIRVLSSKSNGWHDISVHVQGGGIQAGYEAKLSFDGEAYPSNPKVPPAHEVVGKVAGKVVVPLSVEGMPLN